MRESPVKPPNSWFKTTLLGFIPAKKEKKNQLAIAN
jgi:hypothetical protein